MSAQIIAIGPPSFQSNDFPSMETLILDRLAMGGQYNPQDLGTLAHLTVLESIAALADIQADMQTSVLGVRLEGELRQLWDAAAAFEESVSAAPIDARTLIRIQPLYNEMQAAYQEVESTLSASAGMSSRAAAHLRGITRLTAAASTMMSAIESDLLAGAPRPPRRAADSDILAKNALLLANDILALIENVKSFQTSELGMECREGRSAGAPFPGSSLSEERCRRRIRRRDRGIAARGQATAVANRGQDRQARLAHRSRAPVA